MIERIKKLIYLIRVVGDIERMLVDLAKAVDDVKHVQSVLNGRVCQIDEYQQRIGKRLKCAEEMLYANR